MERNSYIELKRKQAEENFLCGYNCCQSVLLAFARETGMDRQTLLKLASGLGGGMARMREVCGTVSAMAVLSGFIKPATDPSIRAERTENYALVQQMAGKFREANGSIVCRELLGLRQSGQQESPEPSERTADYYKTRPCAKFVGQSATIIAEFFADSL